MKKSRPSYLKKHASSYLFVLPFLLFFLIFTVLPVLMSILLSFTDFNTITFPSFVGLENYMRMLLDDPVFLISLKNTLLFAVVTGPVSYILCVLLAWLVNEMPHAIKVFFTVVFYAPSLTTNAVLIWTLIFSGDAYGFINSTLIQLGLIQDPILWLTDEKKYTLEQMKAILEDDYPDEAVRAEFMHKAPKFGNDIDEVDTIAVNILNYCCDLLNGFSEKYSLSFHAQPFTFYWMVEHGENSAASPDGRHKGEIIAYSCSPMQGRDFNGLTAVLNSIAKLPAERTPGTISAIVEADPKLFCDVNMDSIVDMLIAASNRGLSNVQFNIIDADTLIEAQKYPDRYNNLAVRVSGFSQKFNLLSPEIQNHIIGRTKHVCL